MRVPRRALIISTIPTTIRSFYLSIADALQEDGIEVVFSSSGGPEIELLDKLGYKVKTLPIRRNPFFPGNIIAILLLAIYLRRERIDIIETTTPVASVVGRIAALIAGVPVRINTIRGLFPKETHRLQAMLYDIVESLLFPITTLTITINREDRDRLLSSGRRDPDRVIILPGGGCGVDLGTFNRDLYAGDKINILKAEFDIDEDDFVITFIGRLARDKGIFDFVRMIRSLEKPERLKALIVGDALPGEHDAISSQDLRKRLAEEGIGDKSIVTGFREDIPELISVSDIVVLPSYREGFGLVLAEAAAMGKPTVAYENAGTREAVENGKTGILVERGDVESLARAVETIAMDADSYDTMSERAYEKAKMEFDKAIVIERYRAVYMSLKGGKSGNAE